MTDRIRQTETAGPAGARHSDAHPRADQGMGHPCPPFPSDFLFGVGTADHQCEAFDPRFPDIWDLWEAQQLAHGAGRRGFTPRGWATDFWRRYPEDVELARELGCTAFRFSLAWARIEPEPGCFSDEALRHYRTLAETIRAAGMQPVITLLHFVWPRHIQERGGLQAPDFPAWFETYATRVREALGDVARYWLTINEPNRTIDGYFRLPVALPGPRHYAWPPGLPADADEQESMRAVAQVIRNLFLAHRAARLALRAGPGGEQRLVSANSNYFGLPPLLRRALNRLARAEGLWQPARERPAPARGRVDVGPLARLRALPGALAGAAGSGGTFAALAAFLSADWWHLGLHGSLPPFLCPSECRDQWDYVALDYYYGTRSVPKMPGFAQLPRGYLDRVPNEPASLGHALRSTQALFPDKPLFIVENGVPGPANDAGRIRRLLEHLREVQCARRDGVNVIGHIVWGLTTTRQWGLPSDSHTDFGLYAIDLDRDPQLIRHRTAVADAYRAVIARRGA